MHVKTINRNSTLETYTPKAFGVSGVLFNNIGGFKNEKK